MTITHEKRELTASERVAMDLRPYLGGRDYDREVFIAETRHYLQMTLDGMLEAGRRLICLKSMEGHGQFLEALGKIGIQFQRAYELMAIAVFVEKHILSKFPDSGNLKRLETMGKTRLLLLSKIPDEVLKEFEAENVLDLKIEEASAMPLDQLQAEVRELRDAVKNGKQQLRRLQEDKDRMAEKVDALLGKRNGNELKAARAAADKMFEHFLAISAMIASEDFRAVFDTPEKVALLKASDNLKDCITVRWEEFGAAVGMTD